MIQLIVLLVFIGVGLYLLNTLVPMDPKIKTVINVLVFLCVFLWLMDAFGFFAGGFNFPRRC